MLLTLTFSELCLAILGRDKAIQQNDALVHGRNSLVLARDVEAVIFETLPLPHLSLPLPPLPPLPLPPTKNEKTTADNIF